MTTQNNLSNLTNNKNAPAKRRGKRADHEGSIYYWKARNRWVSCIRLGYNPQTGKEIRKKKYSRTQQEALAALEELKVKYAAVTSLEADTLSVQEWMEKWLLVYVAPRIRDNTLVGYRSVLKHIYAAVGNIKLSKLTEFDLQQFLWRDLGKHYRTAQMARMLLKSAMRRAIKCHLLNQSPAADLELPKKPPKRQFHKPSPEDWQALVDFQSSLYYCWRWIILTEFVTGTRMSELLALRWEDFSFQRDEQGKIAGGMVHIQHALYQADKKDPETGKRPLRLGSTKTQQGDRQLSLPADFCVELDHYRRQQLIQRMKTQGWQETGFVFTRLDGQPINPSRFSNYYRYTRKRLGIATTFHMLRHDMASRMKSANIFDLKDIQSQLGHSSIKITMDIYTHMDLVAKTKVSNWLEGGVNELLSSQPVKAHKIP